MDKHLFAKISFDTAEKRAPALRATSKGPSGGMAVADALKGDMTVTTAEDVGDTVVLAAARAGDDGMIAWRSPEDATAAAAASLAVGRLRLRGCGG